MSEMQQARSVQPPAPRIFVWAVWAAMLAVVLWHFLQYSRDLPLAEDWNMVAALTGHEGDLVSWLWSQNNEHRVPLPRLVMLAVLKATGGDFRAGMVLNIALIALLAVAMIEVARRVRGGHTRYTDAFFPILLLEVGNWQNLFWSWQLTFVLSVVIISVALLTLLLRPGLDSPGAAGAIGAALVLAPLTGGTGLLFLPPLLLWAAWRGWRLVRSGDSTSQRRAGSILLGAVGLTVAITAVYLIGYHRPAWVPDNPGLGKSLVTAAQFQTFGLGPAVRVSWGFWMFVALVLFLAATARVIPALRRTPAGAVPGGGLRAWGLLVGLASVACFAAGMGWGRAAVINVYNGWPDRYVLLAALAFCLAYFIWELPGNDRAGRLGRWALFGIVVLLAPMNTAFGREYGNWYVTGMDRVIRDIRLGLPSAHLASRHLRFLVHWWDPPRLATHMEMLHDEGIGPLARMTVSEDTTPPARLDTLTLRYRMEEAGAVNLVWWTDPAIPLSHSLRTTGTRLASQGRGVSTPMQRQDGTFTVRLEVPRGAALQYGFMITARNDLDTISGVWDGNRRYEPGSVSGPVVVDAEPEVTLLTNPLRGSDTLLARLTVRYGPTDARRVRVIWGIDGWQRLPESRYPRNTSTVSHMMVTRMDPENSRFAATLLVPRGRRLDFAFQVDRADRSGVRDNNFGRNYSVMAGGDSSIVIPPKLTFVAGSRLTTIFQTGGLALLLVAVLGGISEGIGRLITRRRIADEPGRI